MHPARSAGGVGPSAAIFGTGLSEPRSSKDHCSSPARRSRRSGERTRRTHLPARAHSTAGGAGCPAPMPTSTASAALLSAAPSDDQDAQARQGPAPPRHLESRGIRRCLRCCRSIAGNGRLFSRGYRGSGRLRCGSARCGGLRCRGARCGRLRCRGARSGRICCGSACLRGRLGFRLGLNQGRRQDQRKDYRQNHGTQTGAPRPH
jgi:hypothetical protein